MAVGKPAVIHFVRVYDALKRNLKENNTTYLRIEPIELLNVDVVLADCLH